ncbi:MAG TPA: nucleotidyltransferase domain-containing protein [Thermoanaerobaculia bacterium]|nr:nucleotidyltransferase domain-containing protein [Thermoanaerobaculia bacterium]
MLGLLFGQPDRRFYSRELIRLAESGTGAVHRQLKRLAAAGLITEVEEGNQKVYQANRESPIFAELHGLVVKTVGAVEPIRRALEPFGRQIRAAFVYGSLARGSDRAGSDIDLLVVTDDLGYPDVYRALEAAEAALARPVNPTVMRTAEWQERRREGDSFVDRIAGQTKLFVIGDEDAFG